ncbi:MAG: hypothetical protein RBT71_05155 [Flavobacteriales bacterium]|jgi:hypothetical protein|nr:hypothetical protein [Flavobacteriales bacterium]
MRLPGSAVQLAVLRIAIGLQIFYAVHSEIFSLLLAVGQRQEVKTVFPTWFEDLLPAMVPVLLPAAKVLALLMVVGLLTRIVVPLLTVVFILLYGFYYLGVDAPIQWLYFWFPLVLLCFAPCNHMLSLDALLFRARVGHERAAGLVQYRWPVELMVGWFVYVYAAAGVAKVLPVIKGMAWLNGQTSKEILYHRYLDSPLHYWLGEPLFNYAGASSIYVVLTIAAVVLELATLVMLFTNRYHLLILALVLGMHLFLYLVGVAGFTQTALVLGLALLPPAWFTRARAVLRT